MKRIYLVISMAVVSIFFLSLIVYYFLFTTKGSSFIVKSVLSKYAESKDIDINKITGSLSEKISLQDVEIRDLEALPRGSIIKIQRIDIYFTSFSLQGLNLEIFNGRLNLPKSEIIPFHGTYKNGFLGINIHSNKVTVRELLDLFAKNQTFKKISGEINDLDIYIRGSFLEPKLKGGFRINKLSRNGFSMINCPSIFDVTLKDLKKGVKIYGEVVFTSGTISGARTTVIKLKESRILFSGDPKRASLDIYGDSTIENTKIKIVLRGTFNSPELKLTSEPPLPQERLLVMLVTGKSWKGTEVALGKGQLSVDLVKDFVDYFVFSGSGSKVAQRLGISDISVTFEQQKKGVGVKKAITEKVDANYAVEQSQAKEQSPTTTQKVGAEYKITESVSIETEKEIKQKNRTEQAQDTQKPDDKLMLKFKKEF